MIDVEQPDLFNTDELSYIQSNGEDGEALERAYSEGTGGDASTEQAKGAVEEAKDDDTEEGDGSERPKYVPHGQFHKERTRRHTAEQEAAELKVKFARAEERLAVLNELVTAGAEQSVQGQTEVKSAWDEPDIDPEEDFSGAMSQLRRRQQEDRESSQQWRQRKEAHDADNQHAQAYVRDAVAYQQQHPEFAQAYRHLMETYHKELTAYGMTDAETRNNHIRDEEKKLAAYALQNRQSPAQIIMQLSQARGFQIPNEGSSQEGVGEQGEGDVAKSAEEVKGKVQSIKKAQKSTPSLSNAGGGAKNGLTMESILAMDDDEFFEKVHKMPLRKRKQLIAGY